MLTVKEAWLWLAEKWDNPIVTKLGEAYINLDGGPSCWGLCRSVISLRHSYVDCQTYYEMMDQLLRAIGLGVGYIYPCTADGAKHRAALCRRLAEECKEKSKP